VDVEGGRSVKDANESLGVPHTEVELVLVDGEPVGFDRRLAGGSRVSVYPHFATLAPDQADTVGPEPSGEVRFVADGHVADDGAVGRDDRLRDTDVELLFGGEKDFG
jgi:hypothetical protein